MSNHETFRIGEKTYNKIAAELRLYPNSNPAQIRRNLNGTLNALICEVNTHEEANRPAPVPQVGEFWLDNAGDVDTTSCTTTMRSPKIGATSRGSSARRDES